MPQEHEENILYPFPTEMPPPSGRAPLLLKIEKIPDSELNQGDISREEKTLIIKQRLTDLKAGERFVIKTAWVGNARKQIASDEFGHKKIIIAVIPDNRGFARVSCLAEYPKTAPGQL